MRVAIPIFKELHLLRKEMLDALGDYAFRADQLLYKGFGDGIIAGCELTTTEDSIILNEGVILFDVQIFLIKTPMSILYHPTNTTNVLKICFSEQMRDANLVYYEMDLSLTEKTERQRGELELCRFKLQEGARLRYQYLDFEDRNTEFDTLNTIYVPYTAKGGSTLSPEIINVFVAEMLESEQLSELDTFFCLQLSGNNGAVTLDTLAAYIWCRDKRPLEEKSNYHIYQELLRILREVKYGQKSEDGQGKRRRRKMWIE